MRKRGRPSVSTFDDPQGLDPSFRVGRASYNFIRQAVQLPFKRPAEYYENKYEEKEMPPARRRKGNFARRAGPVARRGRSRLRSAAASQRAMSRKRKGFGKRRNRPSKYAKFVRKRGSGRRGRMAFPRWMRKHIKLNQMVITRQATFNLTRVGDNLQNKCSWLAVEACMNINDVDIAMNRITQYELKKVAVTVPAVPFGPVDFNVSDNLTTATNIAAPAYPASDTQTHLNEAKLIVTKQKSWMQVKNQCNKRIDITVFKLTPRRDTPGLWHEAFAGQTIGGINKAWLQVMWATGTQPPILNTANGAYLVPDRLVAWDEHNADPFQSAMPKYFKIKKMQRKFMEPGTFFQLKVHMKRPKYFNKITDGTALNGTYSSTWQHLRKMGFIYLIRAQGSATHDSTSCVVPNNQTATVTMTMGGFNAEIFKQSEYHFHGLGENRAKKKRVTITDPLPVFAVANERNFELRQEQNDAMDYA